MKIKHPVTDRKAAYAKTRAGKCAGGVVPHRPLRGKSLFLDLHGYKGAATVEKHLRILGANIERCFSREVDVLVTGKGAPKDYDKRKGAGGDGATSASAGSPATPSPFNLTSVKGGLESPLADSPGTGEGTSKPITRGQAIAQKANVTKNYGSSNVVECAKRWKIKIVHIEQTQKYIQREIEKVPPELLQAGPSQKVLPVSFSYANSESTTPKVVNKRHKVRRLRKNYIKFEARIKHYRPLKQEFESFPRVHFDTPIGRCPFDSAPKGQRSQENELERAERGEERDGQGDEEEGGLQELEGGDTGDTTTGTPAGKHRSKEVKAKSPTTNHRGKNHKRYGGRRKPLPSSHSDGDGDGNGHYQTNKLFTAGELRQIVKDKARADLKRGYCELCEVKYENIDKHVVSDQHKKFVRNNENYRSLDAMISQGPNIDQFLEDVLQYEAEHAKERLSESDTEEEEVLLLTSPKLKSPSKGSTLHKKVLMSATKSSMFNTRLAAAPQKHSGGRDPGPKTPEKALRGPQTTATGTHADSESKENEAGLRRSPRKVRPLFPVANRDYGSAQEVEVRRLPVEAEAFIKRQAGRVQGDSPSKSAAPRMEGRAGVGEGKHKRAAESPPEKRSAGYSTSTRRCEEATLSDQVVQLSPGTRKKRSGIQQQQQQQLPSCNQGQGHGTDDQKEPHTLKESSLAVLPASPTRASRRRALHSGKGNDEEVPDGSHSPRKLLRSSKVKLQLDGELVESSISTPQRKSHVHSRNCAQSNEMRVHSRVEAIVLSADLSTCKDPAKSAAAVDCVIRQGDATLNAEVDSVQPAEVILPIVQNKVKSCGKGHTNRDLKPADVAAAKPICSELDYSPNVFSSRYLRNGKEYVDAASIQVDDIYWSDQSSLSGTKEKPSTPKKKVQFVQRDATPGKREEQSSAHVNDPAQVGTESTELGQETTETETQTQTDTTDALGISYDGEVRIRRRTRGSSRSGSRNSNRAVDFVEHSRIDMNGEWDGKMANAHEEPAAVEIDNKLQQRQSESDSDVEGDPTTCRVHRKQTRRKDGRARAHAPTRNARHHTELTAVEKYTLNGEDLEEFDDCSKTSADVRSCDTCGSTDSEFINRLTRSQKKQIGRELVKLDKVRIVRKPRRLNLENNSKRRSEMGRDVSAAPDVTQQPEVSQTGVPTQAPPSSQSRSRTFRLQQKWNLLSDNSMSRLFQSEADPANFEGFDSALSTLPSDLTYEEVSEVEMLEDSEGEWTLSDEDNNDNQRSGTKSSSSMVPPSEEGDNDDGTISIDVIPAIEKLLRAPVMWPSAVEESPVKVPVLQRLVGDDGEDVLRSEGSDNWDSQVESYIDQHFSEHSSLRRSPRRRKGKSRGDDGSTAQASVIAASTSTAASPACVGQRNVSSQNDPFAMSGLLFEGPDYEQLWRASPKSARRMTPETSCRNAAASKTGGHHTPSRLKTASPEAGLKTPTNSRRRLDVGTGPRHSTPCQMNRTRESARIGDTLDDKVPNSPNLSALRGNVDTMEHADERCISRPGGASPGSSWIDEGSDAEGVKDIDEDIQFNFNSPQKMKERIRHGSESQSPATKSKRPRTESPVFGSPVAEARRSVAAAATLSPKSKARPANHSLAGLVDRKISPSKYLQHQAHPRSGVSPMRSPRARSRSKSPSKKRFFKKMSTNKKSLSFTYLPRTRLTGKEFTRINKKQGKHSFHRSAPSVTRCAKKFTSPSEEPKQSASREEIVDSNLTAASPRASTAARTSSRSPCRARGSPPRNSSGIALSGQRESPRKHPVGRIGSPHMRKHSVSFASSLVTTPKFERIKKSEVTGCHAHASGSDNSAESKHVVPKISPMTKVKLIGNRSALRVSDEDFVDTTVHKTKRTKQNELTSVTKKKNDSATGEDHVVPKITPTKKHAMITSRVQKLGATPKSGKPTVPKSPKNSRPHGKRHSLEQPARNPRKKIHFVGEMEDCAVRQSPQKRRQECTEVFLPTSPRSSSRAQQQHRPKDASSKTSRHKDQPPAMSPVTAKRRRSSYVNALTKVKHCADEESEVDPYEFECLVRQSPRKRTQGCAEVSLPTSPRSSSRAPHNHHHHHHHQQQQQHQPKGASRRPSRHKDQPPAVSRVTAQTRRSSYVNALTKVKHCADEESEVDPYEYK